MKHLVFVYGTLRKDFHNNHYLNSAKFEGEGSAYGVKLYDVGPFPAVLPEKGAVHGEIYEVDDRTLARLDMLEGVPHLYRRELVECDLDDDSDREFEAYIYIWNQSPDRLTLIPGGDYKEYSNAVTSL